MNSREIRRAALEDLEVLVDFRLKMALETENLKLDIDTLRKGVRSILTDKIKGTYYIIWEEREAIGCLLTTSEWSEWRNGTVLWIQSVYVKEGHRNTGIFKELYLHIKDKVSKNEELKGLRLYVDKSNKRAQEVYAKVGMDGHHYQLFEWMK